MPSRLRTFLFVAVPLASLLGCGVFWLPRCPRPLGERWTEVRLASSPDPELAQSGQGRLFVSAVIDHRGHVDSSITLGLAISPLGRDSVVARNERTVGWTRFDALPAGMWRVQPYRYFFAELTPFVVESRAGYADSVRVAFRFTKVVYVACRARRST